MESPGFLSSDYNTTLSICTLAFPYEWMGKAFSVVWFLVFGGLPIPLMATFYSTVVYNLWFKRNDQNEISYQQQVWPEVVLLIFNLVLLGSFKYAKGYSEAHKKLNLHKSQVTLEVGADPIFRNMKQLGLFLPLPGWDVHGPSQNTALNWMLPIYSLG